MVRKKKKTSPIFMTFFMKGLYSVSYIFITLHTMFFQFAAIVEILKTVFT